MLLTLAASNARSTSAVAQSMRSLGFYDRPRESRQLPAH
jgi:hypothetical protein